MSKPALSAVSRLPLLLLVALPLAQLHAATLTIADLQDVDFGTVSPTTPGLTQQTNFCVIMDPTGPYQIIGRGVETGRFVMVGVGSSAELPYRVYVSWRKQGLGSELSPGVPVTGLRGGKSHPQGRCVGIRRTFLTVVVEADALSRAPAGQYSGRLALTVAPE